MRPSPYVVQALKYATLTLLGIVVVIGAVAVMQNTKTDVLTGRLVSEQEQGIIPTMNFDQKRTNDGFVAPKDTHVIFTLPEGTRIPRITFFGGAETDKERYWGYCFSGNEVSNKAAGRTGPAMYDGQFFYSLGERLEKSKRPPQPAGSDLVGILRDAKRPAAQPEAPASIAEIFQGGKTCYVMSSVDLPAGMDADGDSLNNTTERELGLNISTPDTDGDGISDGGEYFLSKTDPHERDTDKDGLSDRCEDKNGDGNLDNLETSPLVTDTDRDGLCDGNGFAPSCPEPKQTVCYQTPANDRECTSRPSGPAFGEDMNQNCIVDEGETDPRNQKTSGRPDWDYKWGLIIGRLSLDI